MAAPGPGTGTGTGAGPGAGAGAGTGTGTAASTTAVLGWALKSILLGGGSGTAGASGGGSAAAGSPVVSQPGSRSSLMVTGGIAPSSSTAISGGMTPAMVWGGGATSGMTTPPLAGAPTTRGGLATPVAAAPKDITCTNVAVWGAAMLSMVSILGAGAPPGGTVAQDLAAACGASVTAADTAAGVALGVLRGASGSGNGIEAMTAICVAPMGASRRRTRLSTSFAHAVTAGVTGKVLSAESPGDLDAWVASQLGPGCMSIGSLLPESATNFHPSRQPVVVATVARVHGRWAQPNAFHPGASFRGEFKTPNGAVYGCILMKQSSEMRHIRCPAFQAVRLAFGGDEPRFSAVFVLPEAGTSVGQVAKHVVTPHAFKVLLDGMALKRGSVTIPRFAVETNVTIDATSAGAFGLGTVLHPAAEHDRVLDNEAHVAGVHPHIVSIIHKTIVAIDESGALPLPSRDGAAAASMEPLRFELVFDRPFLWLLVDDSTGEVVVAAQIANPGRVGADPGSRRKRTGAGTASSRTSTAGPAPDDPASGYLTPATSGRMTLTAGPATSSTMQVGSVVQVSFGGFNHAAAHAATIVNLNGDGTVDVRWHDSGEVHRFVSRAWVRPATSISGVMPQTASTAPPSTSMTIRTPAGSAALSVGDRVTVAYDGRPPWVPGFVVRVNPDATLDIQHDDAGEDVELHVPLDWVQPAGSRSRAQVDAATRPSPSLSPEPAASRTGMLTIGDYVEMEGAGGKVFVGRICSTHRDGTYDVAFGNGGDVATRVQRAALRPSTAVAPSSVSTPPAGAEPGGAPTHAGVSCRGCAVPSITGVRYMCTVCAGVDFCQSCVEHSAGGSLHEPTHLLLRVPDSSVAYVKPSMFQFPVPVRAAGSKCPRCNTAVPSQAKFCPQCAHRLQATTTQLPPM